MAPGRQQPARLFYVIGASGAGKDSLLQQARQQLPEGAAVVFAHRYITRPAHSGGENHIALSEREFATRLARGCFAMHWRSHGLHYAIGVEVRHWLELGLDVAMNGSRAYLSTAAQQFPQLTPVHIEVAPAVLQQRLIARGRETPAAVEARLQRSQQIDTVDHPALVRIDNNRDLASATQALLDLLCGGMA